MGNSNFPKSKKLVDKLLSEIKKVLSLLVFSVESCLLFIQIKHI